MAKNSTDDITYFIRIERSYIEDLSMIRCWDNLKLGIDDNVVWIKDFNWQQIHSVEVKSIPSKSVFYSKENKLFPLNSLLPSGNIPSVLWTPIERALPLTVPSFNYNYFGIEEKISLQLVSSEEERDGYAILVKLNDLAKYIESSPAIRSQSIKWVGIKEQTALLLGTPLLPVNGEVFWRKNNFLIPAGFDLEWPQLEESIRSLLGVSPYQWVIWNRDSSYFVVDADDLRTLSIGSFRLTFAK